MKPSDIDPTGLIYDLSDDEWPRAGRSRSAWWIFVEEAAHKSLETGKAVLLPAVEYNGAGKSLAGLVQAHIGTKNGHWPPGVMVGTKARVVQGRVQIRVWEKEA